MIYNLIPRCGGKPWTCTIHDLPVEGGQGCPQCIRSHQLLRECRPEVTLEGDTCRIRMTHLPTGLTAEATGAQGAASVRVHEEALALLAAKLETRTIEPGKAL